MPQIDGVRVIRSSIHGYGVIATRHFERDEIIVVGDGVIWREEEEFDDEYSLILPAYLPDGSEDPAGTNLYCDLTDQTRWINHSCDPNSEVDSEVDPDTGEITPWWVALRDIEPGEELTYDYCFSGHLAIPCNCETALCRGLIVDPDELDLVPKKYRKLVKPGLLRKVG